MEKMTEKELAKLKELQAKERRIKREKKKREKEAIRIIDEELGMPLKEAKKVLENCNKNEHEFVQKIARFYGLENEADFDKFLQVMLNEQSRTYFENHRAVTRSVISPSVG